MRHSVMSRPLVLLAALAAALMLVVVLGMPPTKVDAAPRTVTKVFSNSNNIQIPATGTSPVAAAPYPSELNAGGFSRGTILDVNLTLKNFSHTFPDDVDVLLAHRGVSRTVMSDVGNGFSVNNVSFVLDDEATSELPDSGQLVGGKFKPTNAAPSPDTFPAPAPVPAGAQAALNGFDGVNPNGVWRLYVVDDVASVDGGQFAGGWSIKIKARVGR